MSIGAVYEATNLIHGVVDYSANIIWGTNTSPELQDEVIITIIATGFIDNGIKRPEPINNIILDKKPNEIKQEPNIENSETIVNEIVEETPITEVPKKDIPPFVKKLFGRK